MPTIAVENFTREDLIRIIREMPEEELAEIRGAAPKLAVRRTLLREAVDQYLKTEISGTSKFKPYRSILRRFVAFVTALEQRETMLLEEIRPGHLAAFARFGSGRNAARPAANYQLMRVFVVRAFLRWALRENLLSGFDFGSKHIGLPRRGLGLPRYLRPREAHMLLELAKKTRNPVRDHALIATLLFYRPAGTGGAQDHGPGCRL